MSTYTKGPWEIHLHNHIDGEFWCSIGANGRGPITDIVGAEGNKAKCYLPVAGMKHLITPLDEQKANAQLIAAAPELLEALEKLVDSLPLDHPTMWSQDQIKAILNTVNDSEDVIAKAKGEI